MGAVGGVMLFIEGNGKTILNSIIDTNKKKDLKQNRKFFKDYLNKHEDDKDSYGNRSKEYLDFELDIRL